MTLKGELGVERAKNKNFNLKLRGKLPSFCFLFDNNRSFRLKVTVENVNSRLTISHNISYILFPVHQ